MADFASGIPAYSWSIMRGDGDKYLITVTQDGVAVDISNNVTLWYTAKKKMTDADAVALIRKDSLGVNGQGGITITDGAHGQAELELVLADTESFTATTKLFHDMQYQRVSESAHTLFTGVLTILLDVTRQTLEDLNG